MGTRKTGKNPTPLPSFETSKGAPTALADRLQNAISLHRNGDATGAETAYLEILRDSPVHFEANLFLGAFYIELGQAGRATAYLKQALQINPHYPQALHYFALALHESGDLGQAVETYEKALALSPTNAEAWLHAGNAYAQLGQDSQAERCYREAVEHRPQFAVAHHQWAEWARRRNDNNQAIDRYRQAIKADRTFFPSINNLATLLKSLGRYEEAIPYLESALKLAPASPESRANLAICLALAGRRDEALKMGQESVRLSPNNALSHESLGRVHQSRGELVEAKSSFQNALRLDAQSVESRVLLGTILLNEGDLASAKPLFEQAHRLSPMDESAAIGLAQIAELTDDVSASQEIYRSLGRQSRNELIAELRAASVCPTIFESEDAIEAYRAQLTKTLEHCRLGNLFHQAEDWVRMGVMPPFNLQFHGRDDRPLKQLYGQTIAETLDFQLGDDASQNLLDRRPRIGIVTLRNDRAFLRSIGGLIKRLNRDQIEPVVVALASSRSILEPALGKFVSFLWLPSSVEQMILALRAARFDLLYYFEIGTTSVGYLLAHQRLAPVQCTSWGIQVTSGIPTIDYYLSSSLVEPTGAANHYTEQLITLDTLLTWQERPVFDVASVSPAHFGLPTDRHLYLCPQQLGKFTPAFDVVLAQLLRMDSNGIVVVTEGTVPPLAAKLRDRWERNIPDVADRLIFISQKRGDEYWHLLRTAHVLLDPMTFGGVNTTYDALAMGKAIVTLPSPFQRGRYTSGCYRAMGMDDCIASSIDDYVSRAIRIASDTDYRMTLEQSINSRSKILFRNDQAVDELNDALLTLATQQGGEAWSS